MQEYIVALSYFSALTIVCLVLYAFTYLLPKPDNHNKARSTFFFRLVLLFTIASFEGLLLRYEHFPVIAIVLDNFFILLIAYSLMFAIYTRYDCDINYRHYLLCGAHLLFFVLLIYLLHNQNDNDFFRFFAVIINISIPYFFTIKKSHQQYKRHRIGDRILYSSLIIIFIVFVAYVALYSFFYSHDIQVPIALYFVTLICCICVLFFGFALSIIYSLVGKLRKEIITDRLTGTKNRNYLTDISEQMISLAKRNNTPLSLILCDIDLFKNINDNYGHAAGDKVLVAFSTFVKQSLRAEDVFIRIGGEEFVILLPQIDLTQAIQTAERIKEIINQQHIEIGSEHIHISASFGVTQVDVSSGIDNNINNADIALYEAKRTGRNKVVGHRT
ncbi:hypothetical protein tinsulaeT_19460 [Thalassotalea insulae]|uniref:diguanylate cyclase n=1 Tax=Thalassotalea insulae TaxID=2056778 RepID=A0ABQ6GWR6_9GAMM|nr:GGDEF domain-containing protein [Thalassotalea insulae]GLX78606.1 hypothetical protein tinsulaeT_19460 [Thalassotalea insulae]